MVANLAKIAEANFTKKASKTREPGIKVSTLTGQVWSLVELLTLKKIFALEGKELPPEMGTKLAELEAVVAGKKAAKK
jgi:hypothetical protein